MRLTTTGVPHRLDKPVVGRMARSPVFEGRDECVLLCDRPPEDSEAYRAVLASEVLSETDLCDEERPVVHSLRHDDHWRDGDIVVLEPGGFVRTIYRPDSAHNAMFVTERCNSNCLMCSQPPKDIDDTDHFLRTNLDLLQLVPRGPASIGITGGEPTLLGDRLLTLLGALRDQWPTTHVHMLTNGRRFAFADFTRAYAAVNHPSLVLGIPIYSDDAVVHDYVVQAKDAFDQTILGAHQLARWDQRIEIRVVLHRLTVPRLVDLAKFIYRNLPFVAHVALMGLEPTGYAPRNWEKLWVDPFDYQNRLEAAVEFLSIRGMDVSIYNLPLCLLPRSVWGFARKSISDWKNIYLPDCEGCGVLERCGGFFASAAKMHSAHIQPLSC